MFYAKIREYRISYYNKEGVLKFKIIHGISRRNAFKRFIEKFPKLNPFKVVLY